LAPEVTSEFVINFNFSAESLKLETTTTTTTTEAAVETTTKAETTQSESEISELINIDEGTTADVKKRVTRTTKSDDDEKFGKTIADDEDYTTLGDASGDAVLGSGEGVTPRIPVRAPPSSGQPRKY